MTKSFSNVLYASVIHSLHNHTTSTVSWNYQSVKFRRCTACEHCAGKCKKHHFKAPLLSRETRLTHYDVSLATASGTQATKDTSPSSALLCASPPPPSSSCTCILLSTSPDLSSRSSLVVLFFCGHATSTERACLAMLSSHLPRACHFLHHICFSTGSCSVFLHNSWLLMTSDQNISIILHKCLFMNTCISVCGFAWLPRTRTHIHVGIEHFQSGCPPASYGIVNSLEHVGWPTLCQSNTGVIVYFSHVTCHSCHPTNSIRALK